MVPCLSTPLVLSFFVLGDDILIDTHYDLLTILYCCYLRNDYSYIEKIKEDLKDVKGLIANLYFMKPKEMKEELGIDNIDVYEMFKISTNLFKEHFKDKKVIFSIEGCDYIKDTDELENLYKLGLRNILLVWNNENKYGSGNRSSKGLTKLGEEFIKKAVELGISIDLSHMNKNTFNDTINLLDKLKDQYKIKVLASHSNCYELCNNTRNLDDEQIRKIKKLNGMVGLVSYGPFINDKLEDLEVNYLKHIKHMEEIIGIDNIMIATDNMDFASYFYIDMDGIDEEESLLKHNGIVNKLTTILKNSYNLEDMKKIMYKNVERLFSNSL